MVVIACSLIQAGVTPFLSGY